MKLKIHLRNKTVLRQEPVSVHIGHAKKCTKIKNLKTTGYIEPPNSIGFALVLPRPLFSPSTVLINQFCGRSVEEPPQFDQLSLLQQIH